MKVTTPPIGTPPLLAIMAAAFCGAVLVAASVATAELSQAFVYGGDYLARPVWTLVSLLVAPQQNAMTFLSMSVPWMLPWVPCLNSLSL